MGVCGRKNKSFRTIHQIDRLNSPLDMIFRQTERGSVNKNHGYMTYSLYLSVLTSQGISPKQISLCLMSIVNGFVPGVRRTKCMHHLS